MATSEYSGLDLGFGVVTAPAGLGLAAIGFDGLRRNGVSPFATISHYRGFWGADKTSAAPVVVGDTWDVASYRGQDLERIR